MVYINLNDVTCGAETADRSGTHEFTSVLSGVRVGLPLVCFL